MTPGKDVYHLTMQYGRSGRLLFPAFMGLEKGHRVMVRLRIHGTEDWMYQVCTVGVFGSSVGVYVHKQTKDCLKIGDVLDVTVEVLDDGTGAGE